MDPDAPQTPAPRQPPPVPHERARATPAEQAARAAWVGPLVALALMLLTWKMPRGTGSIIIAIINTALLLAGLCLGIVALARAKDQPLRGMTAQAGIGVGLSLLIIVVMIWTKFFLELPKPAPTTEPVTNRASTAPRDAILDYPGWVGNAVAERAGFIAISYSNDVPGIPEFKKNFGKDFVVMMVKVNTSAAPFDVYVDTTRSVAHFTDGHTESALSIRDLLESAVQNKDKLRDHWLPPRRCVAGGRGETDVMIPLAPGTLLENIDRVTITANGLPVDVPGRYLTVAQKSQTLRRNP